MSLATLETFMAGPMAFDHEKLSDAQCDMMMDLIMWLHARKWHRGHPPETIPDSIRKDL